jgi:hypothetical protein
MSYLPEQSWDAVPVGGGSLLFMLRRGDGRGMGDRRRMMRGGSSILRVVRPSLPRLEALEHCGIVASSMLTFV